MVCVCGARYGKEASRERGLMLWKTASGQKGRSKMWNNSIIIYINIYLIELLGDMLQTKGANYFRLIGINQTMWNEIKYKRKTRQAS